MATLTAAVYRDGAVYVARCLDVEVTSEGSTVPEALTNLQEALELYFDDEIPADTTVVAVNTLQVGGRG